MSRFIESVPPTPSTSGEHAEGFSQINRGVSELDTVTQQNAGNAEELASCAHQTAEHVVMLRETISQFKLRSDEPSIV